MQDLEWTNIAPLIISALSLLIAMFSVYIANKSYKVTRSVAEDHKPALSIDLKLTETLSDDYVLNLSNRYVIDQEDEMCLEISWKNGSQVDFTVERFDLSLIIIETKDLVNYNIFHGYRYSLLSHINNRIKSHHGEFIKIPLSSLPGNISQFIESSSLIFWISADNGAESRVRGIRRGYLLDGNARGNRGRTRGVNLTLDILQASHDKIYDSIFRKIAAKNNADESTALFAENALMIRMISKMKLMGITCDQISFNVFYTDPIRFGFSTDRFISKSETGYLSSIIKF